MNLLDEMVRLFQVGKKIDPLSHKALEKVTQRQAKNVASVAGRWGWDGVEDMARQDYQEPSKAIAKKSLVAGALMAPNLWGGGVASKGGAGVSAANTVNTGEQLAQAGMFAPQATQTATEQAIQQQLLLQQAAEAAAQNAGQGITSGGLFNQVPGVTSGSPQWQALAEQNAGMGGKAWDLTASGAKPAVTDAVRSGQMGRLEGIMQTLKGDAAGMNDPTVWLDRFGKNASRMSGQAARSMASNALAPKPGPQYQPAPVPRAPAPQPKPAVDSASMSQAVADLKAGKITMDEFLRMMGGA